MVNYQGYALQMRKWEEKLLITCLKHQEVIFTMEQIHIIQYNLQNMENNLILMLH